MEKWDRNNNNKFVPNWKMHSDGTQRGYVTRFAIFLKS